MWFAFPLRLKVLEKEHLNQADSWGADTAVRLQATFVVIQPFVNFKQRHSPSPLQFQLMGELSPHEVFEGVRLGKVPVAQKRALREPLKVSGEISGCEKWPVFQHS